MFNKKDKETASHSEPDKNTDIAVNITGDAVCTTVVARQEIGQTKPLNQPLVQGEQL